MQVQMLKKVITIKVVVVEGVIIKVAVAIKEVIIKVVAGDILNQEIIKVIILVIMSNSEKKYQ